MFAIHRLVAELKGSPCFILLSILIILFLVPFISSFAINLAYTIFVEKAQKEQETRTLEIFYADKAQREQKTSETNWH